MYLLYYILELCIEFYFFVYIYTKSSSRFVPSSAKQIMCDVCTVYFARSTCSERSFDALFFYPKTHKKLGSTYFGGSIESLIGVLCIDVYVFTLFFGKVGVENIVFEFDSFYNSLHKFKRMYAVLVV